MVSDLMTPPRALRWLRRVGGQWSGRRWSGRRREFGDLGGAVLAAVHQGDEVCFLAAVALGLLGAQPAFGLGDLHALAGAEPDQVGLELGHHGQDVEQ